MAHPDHAPSNRRHRWLGVAGLCGGLWGGLTCCVQAAEVFRCGESGAVRYQATPCEDGRRINAQDTRDTAQQQAAQASAQRQARMAQALQDERDRSTGPQRPVAGATVIGQRPRLDDTPPAAPRKPRIIKGKKQPAPKAAPTPPPHPPQQATTDPKPRR